MEKIKVAATLAENSAQTCMTDKDWERLSEAVNLSKCFDAAEDKAAYHKAIAGAEILLTGWGAPPVTKEELALMPDLKFISHGAGSVAYIVTADAWDTGIRVSTANDVLAESVALTALSYSIDGLKQSFVLANLYKEAKGKGCVEKLTLPMREIYGLKIGIVGFGAVGRHLARLTLAVTGGDSEILVSDPGVTTEEIEKAVCTESNLDEICKECDVIQNCVPWNDKTEGLFSHNHFKMMKDDAIYVNTGRGATTDEAGLAEELKKGRLQAYLDVQYPEPPVEENPLWGLDNCILLPHLAGFRGNGRERMGKFAIDEIIRFVNGEELKGEISREYAEGMTGSNVEAKVKHV
ncbi:MAG: hydroxyacid dehydrogenase [Planctomycetota bacterium]|jgi:phosphoglycerate dehydrogenase-like enzyme